MRAIKPIGFTKMIDCRNGGSLHPDNKPRLRLFFRKTYEEISEWRKFRKENIDEKTKLLPSFEEWMGDGFKWIA